MRNSEQSPSAGTGWLLSNPEAARPRGTGAESLGCGCPRQRSPVCLPSACIGWEQRLRCRGRRWPAVPLRKLLLRH